MEHTISGRNRSEERLKWRNQLCSRLKRKENRAREHALVVITMPVRQSKSETETLTDTDDNCQCYLSDSSRTD